jgi:hypothetical protein
MERGEPGAEGAERDSEPTRRQSREPSPPASRPRAAQMERGEIGAPEGRQQNSNPTRKWRRAP